MQKLAPDDTQLGADGHPGATLDPFRGHGHWLHREQSQSAASSSPRPSRSSSSLSNRTSPPPAACPFDAPSPNPAVSAIAARPPWRAVHGSETGSPVRQQDPESNPRPVALFQHPARLCWPNPSRSGAAHPANPSASVAPSMPYTGDTRAQARSGSSSRVRLNGWFGRAAGSTSGEPDTPSSATDSTLARSTARPAAHPSPANAASPAASNPRFAFLATSMSALRGTKAAAAAGALSSADGDELASLDVESALFPHGPACDGDAFSPAAFKNLQMTATGLLHRFQHAYKQRTTELRETRAEREAQEEEKEEAETRTRHLRMQLEGLARQAAEQQAIMEDLMLEMSKEKRLRAESQQTRHMASAPSEYSTLSEDLGAEEDQQRWRNIRRTSGDTAQSYVSLDTDEDSFDEASVFSRPRSPTTATNTAEAAGCPVEPPPHRTAGAVSPRRPPSSVPAATTPTPFQRLFRGTQADTQVVTSCRNCRGQDARMAWDTAGLLRVENRGLKGRVGELEAAVEAALDVVHGLCL